VRKRRFSTTAHGAERRDMPNTEQKARLTATVRNFRDSDAEREGAGAELDCLLMEELVQGSAQLSTSIFDSKKTLGERLSELTAELKGSSVSAENQARALVTWTKGLVFVTAVYAVIEAVRLMLGR